MILPHRKTCIEFVHFEPLRLKWISIKSKFKDFLGVQAFTQTQTFSLLLVMWNSSVLISENHLEICTLLLFEVNIRDAPLVAKAPLFLCCNPASVLDSKWLHLSSRSQWRQTTAKQLNSHSHSSDLQGHDAKWMSEDVIVCQLYKATIFQCCVHSLLRCPEMDMTNPRMQLKVPCVRVNLCVAGFNHL